jgi:hypothetical protein
VPRNRDRRRAHRAHVHAPAHTNRQPLRGRVPQGDIDGQHADELRGCGGADEGGRGGWSNEDAGAAGENDEGGAEEFGVAGCDGGARGMGEGADGDGDDEDEQAGCDRDGNGDGGWSLDDADGDEDGDVGRAVNTVWERKIKR